MRAFFSRGRRVAALAVMLLAVAGGIAWASIPGSDGVYSACRLNNVGTIRLIDPALPASSLLSHCVSGETLITWNKGGPTGPKGPPGDKGPVGDKGATGDKGPVGDKGPTGDKGPVGDKGATGDKGAVGDRGPTGDKGPAGDQGPAGDKGPIGDKGPTGDRGPDGDKGATGDPGGVSDHFNMADPLFPSVPFLGDVPLINVNLPAGKWVISAKGQLAATTATDVTCRLVDLAAPQVFDIWQGQAGTGGADATVALLSAASLPADTTIWLQCNGGTHIVTMRYPKLNAFQASVIATP